MISPWITVTGPEKSLTFFGIRLIGINVDTGYKVLVTLIYILAIMIVEWLVKWLTHFATQRNKAKLWAFWLRQAVRIVAWILIIVGVISIWANNTKGLGTFLGLFSAGLAFALQRVVTALAGYIVILRANTFRIGDRITMGGVRGDVIKLGFIQTTIMEMGEPPGVQEDEPSMWVRARQYTGRVVMVTNDKVFDTPIYNYTREFPYIWEEMHLPISYKDDVRKAEQIILKAANDHTVKISDMSQEALQEMERRYVMKRTEMQPRVYFRLTDNWIQLSVRFISYDYGVRLLKDSMSRQILTDFQAAHIGIASSTYDVVGMPPIQVTLADGPHLEGKRTA